MLRIGDGGSTSIPTATKNARIRMKNENFRDYDEKLISRQLHAMVGCWRERETTEGGK